jgi:hypothetical protein
MFYQDVAGLQPRADGIVELWPIDMGLDHFTVNNLSYHGRDVTIVWQKPGGQTFYPNAPAGFSLYVNGQRAFTVDDLAHVTWDSGSGAVQVLDSTGAAVTQHAAGDLPAARAVDLTGNARLVDGFQKAGVSVSGPNGNGGGSLVNLALGATATASFTTTSPAAQATDPANAVDGFTISGLPVVSGPYVGTNPIWGDLGSPNAQDWLQIDFGKQVRFDDVKLYFYSNKAFGSGGNTYREPSAYTVQYFNGSSWVDIPGEQLSPQVPAPNYNDVTLSSPVVARQIRILMTRTTGFAVGLKEIQVFNTKG